MKTETKTDAEGTEYEVLIPEHAADRKKIEKMYADGDVSPPGFGDKPSAWGWSGDVSAEDIENVDD